MGSSAEQGQVGLTGPQVGTELTGQLAAFHIREVKCFYVTFISTNRNPDM